MVPYWKSLFLIAVTAAFLAGCGTETPSSKEEEAKGKQTVSLDETSTNMQPSEPTGQEIPPVDEQKQAGGGQNGSKGDETDFSRPTTSLSYQIGNQTVTGTATLTTSDNQHFSLYVLEGWTLDAEEPHADVLLHGDTFARIRLLPNEETNYEQLAKEHAQAIDANAARQQTNQLPKPFTDALWYIAQADGVTVHVIASTQPAPMLLTVHAPKGKDVLGAVLAMVATLQKQ
ncbi:MULTISPECIES: hypothetical protein [Geobacillus]|jgi:hypothetical protein|uniref:Lipoprotein n=1 Tax=Geobacillus thermodenitrificans (strain NG80-2) TaxID=420246 RepID=A4IKM7_GEOTN|nr:MULTISPECIES: hypothetical protein [Geobacillus]ABO65881.1 Conserved hypothetical protein [Geobacillus thermodenitrificans NG80-2]ARP41609.1 hypothetical protein GTHT12_00044 [Geobacillus thermodenitrificans]ATO37007.1 hypothetical protein GTID1_06985 [Geobacillus thermodenitrificans]MED3717683.1 hypothetical protein [Geobacillus thermodenitrificans]MED3905946.1 hypothetical protein [Geobacillus thermodenitrificans]